MRLTEFVHQVTKEIPKLQTRIALAEKSLNDLQRELSLLRESQLAVSAPGSLAEFSPRKHPFVSLGEGVTIAPGVRIMAPSAEHAVDLGDHVKIYRGTEILGPVRIGERSFINRDGYVRARVTIGSRVAIGAYCRLVTDNHELGGATQRAGKFFTMPIDIGDGVFIGANVTVIGGVKIGAGSIVGAGAVVVRDVPPNSVVGGVPARVIRLLNP